MTFTFDQLSEPLVKATTKLGYENPTEIQEKAIPVLLNNDVDFVGQAQTGTGKTAAFCLPLLEKIDLSKRGVKAMILAPTRELAIQIHQEIEKFSSFQKVSSITVYGGSSYKKQIDGLRTADIVIATPGRAIDLLDRGKLNLSGCEHFIVDEADEMLKMGFIEDVETLMENVSETANIWMFSATMPPAIVKLIETKLDNPEIIRVKKKTLTNENVSQSYCRIERRDFLKMLKVILLSEDSFYGIIFCETKEETRQLAEKLMHLDRRVTSLHGDLNQRQREIAIDLFKNRKVDILVCTDVAARGLDISQVTHVINMGIPRNHESYIHRIGRTGRAGEVGKAITFVSPRESRSLQILERLTKQKISNYEIPRPGDVKRHKIKIELEKMQGIKEAITEKGSSFIIDESFEYFNEHFQDLSKDQIVKVLFSYHFNKDLRLIDESIENLSAPKAASVQNYRQRRRTRAGGGRSFNDSRGERRSDNSRGRRRPYGESRDERRSFGGDRDERRSFGGNRDEKRSFEGGRSSRSSNKSSGRSNDRRSSYRSRNAERSF